MSIVRGAQRDYVMRTTGKKAKKTRELSPGDRRLGTSLLYFSLLLIFARPQDFIPGLGSIPLAGAVIYAHAIWAFVHLGFIKNLKPCYPLIAIMLAIIVSSLDAQGVRVVHVMKTFLTQYFPLYFSLILLLDSRDKVNRMLTFWVLIHGIVAVITILKGGIGPGSFIANQNDVALALTMCIPFAFYLFVSSRDRSFLIRLFLLTCMVLMLVALVTTQSRGGFVALSAAGFCLWWFSRRRTAIALTVGLLALLTGGLTISLLPDDYVREIQSITDPSNSTRVERLRTWEVAWIMYKNNPINGVGVWNFPFHVEQYLPETSWWTGFEKSLQGRVTHSVYFEVISELGTIGVLVFGYALFVLPWHLYQRWKEIRGLSQARDLRRNLQMALAAQAAFLSGSAFISVTYYPFLPLWLAFVMVFLRDAPLYGGNDSRRRRVRSREARVLE